MKLNRFSTHGKINEEYKPDPPSGVRYLELARELEKKARKDKSGGFVGSIPFEDGEEIFLFDNKKTTEKVEAMQHAKELGAKIRKIFEEAWGTPSEPTLFGTMITLQQTISINSYANDIKRPKFIIEFNKPFDGGRNAFEKELNMVLKSSGIKMRVTLEDPMGKNKKGEKYQGTDYQNVTNWLLVTDL